MKTLRIFALLAASVLLISSVVLPAHATPMLETNMGGEVIGVTDLEVDGMTFDVAFSAGGQSYDQAVGALGDSFNFDLAAATLAADALTSFFNLVPTTPSQLAFGTGSDLDRHDILVPFDIQLTSLSARDVFWAQAPQEWVQLALSEAFGRAETSGAATAYAIFAKDARVPEPASALLFAAGLCALLWLHRRRRV